MPGISKLQPHRSLYLRGFDRRGAAASLHNASAAGFTLSGCWSDQADFAVAVLFDADDVYGHLFTSRYLPDFSLAGVTLDFDLALTGCQNPISTKYQSVPWGALSYITRSVSGGVVSEVQASVPLNITAQTGGAAAGCTYTVNGTPVIYDRVQLVYLGNVVFDHVVASGEAASEVAAAIVSQLNAMGGVLMAVLGVGSSFTVYARGAQAEVNTSGTSVTLNAFGGPGNPSTFAGFAPGPVVIYGSHYTIATVNPTSMILTSSAGTLMGVMAYCPAIGTDGNSIQLLELHKTGTCYLTPAGNSALTGGVDPTSIHVHLDFSALGLASVRQLWLTFAPALRYGSGALGPYLASEWTAVFSNWTVGDPGGITPLKVSGPGSVTVTSSDSWARRAGTGWTQIADWYVGGFAWQSAHAGDTVTVTYSCQSTHDLYLGTSISTAGGTFDVAVGGGAAVTMSAYSLQSSASPTSGRRLIVSGIAAGSHTVVLTVTTGTCLFDFLQAAVLSDPVAPAASCSGVGCACDFDTGQTYQIAPARLLWILSQAGFAGDIDFYSGVFFALKRARNGGNSHQATVTISGTPATGTGFGDGDAVFFDISRTSLGAAAYPADTVTTLAQRLVNAINATFVGVCAAPTSTAGQFTVTSLSPINGFTMTVSGSTDAAVSIAMTGDIGAGNEGTWGVDPTQAVPLNRAFRDYLADLAGLVKAVGQTMTVAFSQELLAPPDSNDAAPVPVAFGFFNYLGTGYAHTITIGSNTYTHVQLSTDGSGDIATALEALINAGNGDPYAAASVSANNVILTPRGAGDIACSASDGNGPGTLKSGAWSQRFANGATVLTATGFGSWGAGVVDGVSGSGPQIVEQIGHGYITGNTVHVAQGSDGAVWSVTVTDADHYQLATLVSGIAFTVAAGATTLIDLQTSQCCFNSATVTAYLQKCYLQAAGILSAAGLVPWLQFGEVGWWFYSRLMNEAIGYASWTAPISIGTVAAHGLATGQNAIVAAVEGATAANGTWPITVIDATHFTETASSGNAAYVAGGTVSGGGMAYYDAYTAAAALTALGRALASFWTQDDDPSVNSHTDANFLRTQVYSHMHAIAQAVKAAYPAAKIEWLLPLDTDNPAVYWNAGYPYPQGGRMNNYVNIPSQYMAPNGDIDRVKLEALSWGASYLNLDLAKAAMAYGFTTLTYAKSATAYLIPWFNGACAWAAQYLAAVNAGMPIICFWAVDHLTLLNWPLPLPINKRRARLF